MRRLRDRETGCPWDIEQTFETIAPYTIEEAYEVADAIERGAWDELEGELGDLLLQSVYHTAIGEEEGHFTFHSVVRNISDKMVARPPACFRGRKPGQKRGPAGAGLGGHQGGRAGGQGAKRHA